MTIEFLARPEVLEILFQIIWGDRSEKDLKTKMNSNESYDGIRDKLVEEGLVYELLGENKSPYLSLTDKGAAVVNRLFEIDRILEGEDLVD